MIVQSQDCGIKAKVLPTALLLINKKPGIRFKPGILAQALSKGKTHHQHSLYASHTEMGTSPLLAFGDL